MSFQLPIEWPVAEIPAGGAAIAERKADTSVPFVVPRLYFRETFPTPREPMPSVLAAPSLKLEALQNVIVGPRRVLFNKEPPALLRPSFNRLGHVWHVSFNSAKEMQRPTVPEDYADFETLDEPVYWADTHRPEVYGHYLLEALSQLWAYQDAGGVKVATSMPPERTPLKLLGALGVNAESIVHLKHCVAPTETFVATPAIMIRDYVHSEVRQVFERLGQLATESEAPSHELLYVSRAYGPRRLLTNETEIEAIFAGAGFTIYHPEKHLIEDQIKTFSGARLIAGPSGSALHNAVFARNLEKLLILCSPDWFNIIDPLLHQREGQVGLLFGDVVVSQAARGGAERDWWIDPHQTRLTLRIFMGV